MTGPAVSVVVASRGRPRDLARCLTALGQLYHRPFEVVVVADQAGRAAVADHPLGSRVVLVACDAPGISLARNLGIAAAAGDLIAFLDDDAVPEPTWLSHLVRGFVDPSVGAVTGFVRGRNGISLQWAARTVDRLGRHGAFDVPSDDPFVPALAGGEAVMLEGTNMVLRRSVLDQIGGFDSGFRFLFDDADMAIRVFVSGWKTAVSPLAQVLHAFSASERRRADRCPTDLSDIGRSLVLYLSKHGASPEEVAGEVAGRRVSERRRLIGHMVAGLCEPRDIGRLLDTFDAGVASADPGASDVRTQEKTRAALRPFVDREARDPVAFAGRPWSRSALRRSAREALAGGHVASVFVFGPTARPHRVRFTESGFWEQSGGLFGPSDRRQRFFRLTGFENRAAEEGRRVAKLRRMPDTGKRGEKGHGDICP